MNKLRGRYFFYRPLFLLKKNYYICLYKNNKFNILTYIYLMKKCCGECPWKVRNNNNDAFIGHSKKFIKKHNCHMIPSKLIGGVWEIKDKHQCFGNKKFLENV